MYHFTILDDVPKGVKLRLAFVDDGRYQAINTPFKFLITANCDTSSIIYLTTMVKNIWDKTSKKPRGTWDKKINFQETDCVYVTFKDGWGKASGELGDHFIEVYLKASALFNPLFVMQYPYAVKLAQDITPSVYWADAKKRLYGELIA